LMISAVIEKVKQFLRAVLELNDAGEDVRIISLTPSDDGWVAKAEVVEKDRILPGHRVFQKKYYVVKVASDLEISFYKQVKDENKRESE
jgi:hypothetical protein